MTIYQAIEKARKLIVVDHVEEYTGVPVTDIEFGKGEAFLCESYWDSAPIVVHFPDGKYGEYDYCGRSEEDGPASLALGHHEGPEATAKAIKGQNFDLEEV